MRHSGGKCVATDGNNKLFLTASCNTKFKITAEGQLQDEEMNCFAAVSQDTNGAYVTRTMCDQPHTYYRRRVTGNIQQISNGYCFHPAGGSATPSEGTNIIFFNNCQDDAVQLHFSFDKGNNL